ncbi:MAG TPA: excinuclease ABC subunit UvrA, partial [Bacillota bacterium]|nr:excinuclease ABC subunit UvrA [Bacillota bacterium]
YHEPSPALFSFNHPVGACPTCRGFGRVISIDYNLAIPDRSKTLAEGAVKPWQSGQSAESQSDLLRMCRHFGVPTNVPFEKLSKKWQDFVIDGEPGYGKDEEHEWPRAWYGIKGYFRWLESKAYKMHVRVLLSRYRTYTPCPVCQGKRFQPEALLYRVHSPEAGVPSPDPTGLTLADFYQLPIRDALRFIDSLAARYQFRKNDPLGLVLGEIRSRLGYLHEVGLGYLTLDRPTRSLSGGETERVNLTTCLGTRLVNTLFVLDEPSVGLHPRDTERLVRILQQLRNAGNTVVVVEHEASVMRAADQILDIGPGHGATGGQIVFQGSYPEILKAKESITGQYLSGCKQVEIPERRPIATPPESDRSRQAPAQSSRFEPLVLHDSVRPIPKGHQAALKLSRATRHNLRDLAVAIPLHRFVCITGVSGSGKTTLVREVLLPALTAQLKAEQPDIKASEGLTSEPANGEEEGSDDAPDAPAAAELEGSEHLGRVVLVDQSILGKTPRSNPAVYIGAFDDVREVFAQSELAKQRGLNTSAFSFNSGQGQCERCRGAGFEKIEMQFLSDVFIRCPDCNGRRYRSHILEIQITPPPPALNPKSCAGSRSSQTPVVQPMSIADLLEATVEEAIAFLSGFAESRPAQRAVQSLRLLEEVGLGYLKLGQPINTLSGGESQRLKLVRELTEAGHATPSDRGTANGSPASGRPTLFLFDEPTTGLHFDDVRVLLKVFQRLVDAGHSVIVIEHNLDVIKAADWLIDLGPDAGDQGGEIVAQGTPEAVAECPQSHTGRALRDVLAPSQQRMAKSCGAKS